MKGNLPKYILFLQWFGSEALDSDFSFLFCTDIHFPPFILNKMCTIENYSIRLYIYTLMVKHVKVSLAHDLV